MQNLKKHLLSVLMAVFVASLASASAHAQSVRLKVNVPFDFSVGQYNLKAGTYRIQNDGTFVTFSNVEGGTTAALLFPGGHAADRNGEPYLRFHRYGDEAFLDKIVVSADQNYSLPRSRREKEILSAPRSVEQMVVSAGASR